ncbi:phosphoribulokinase [Caldinitratiruptor microaerophilus]|uniref:Phosphoribulokinase n=1 Tax=Caldinitratiruptor microaerophilus TaxID=671077 RepID=A0AA35CKB9_9FIRM|nr:phosphoribulokinase [Caldinitratiruptor microaerophilus]BDG59097.1 hypothetical protein caldi_01870 [Caldinitratiruptor microaerophilus]
MARTSVILVGIAGDSGAGKSTFAEALRQRLGRARTTVVGLDDYHLLDREERKRLGVTALHPKANNFGLLVDHVWQLRQGRSVLKPVYDHQTGTFGRPERVVPRDVVLLEGLHPFLMVLLRELLDFKIYYDTHRDLRVRWKVQRDAAERGYTEEEVRREIERRRPDVERYVEPQRRHADLLIRLLPGGRGDDGVRVCLLEPARAPSRVVRWVALAARFGLLGAAPVYDRLHGRAFHGVDLADPVPAAAAAAVLEMADVPTGAGDALNGGDLTPVEFTQTLVAGVVRTLADGAEIPRTSEPHLTVQVS